MPRSRHTAKLVSSGIALIVVACLWYFFAPTALGGSTTYVVTDGVSMEPRFHSGDLVLVRSQGSYHVGQIVAYHSNAFHTVVLHRIVGRAGDRYVFKGDNNNFVDFEHPAGSQLMGALWMHIPTAGGKLLSIRSPALIGVLVAAAILLFTGAAFARRHRRRRRQRRAGEGGRGPLATASPGLSEPAVGVLAIGLIALLPFVALALLAFTRASSAPQLTNVPYTQTGALSYSAQTRPGAAYPSGRAGTGDPLFTHVLDTVDVRFGYRFHADADKALSGKATLSAMVASSSGWHTTVRLGGPTYFHGDHTAVTGALDLSSLISLIRRLEASTGVRGSYSLTVQPHVTTTGTLDGVPLHATFSPPIRFSLDQLEAQPQTSSPGTPAGPSSASSGEPSSASPFTPSAPASVTGRRYQPLSLSLGFARVRVGTARAIALVAIVIIAATMMALLALVRPRRRDQAATIRARYGRLLVPVARVWQEPGVAVIDVEDMESLAAIAEHYDRSILHETGDDGEAFWVTDESGQFRYAPAAAIAPASAPVPTPAGFAAPTAEAATVEAPAVETPIVVAETFARRAEDPLTYVGAPEPWTDAQPPAPEPAVEQATAELTREDHDDWRAAYQAADANRPRTGPVLAYVAGLERTPPS